MEAIRITTSSKTPGRGGETAVNPFGPSPGLEKNHLGPSGSKVTKCDGRGSNRGKWHRQKKKSTKEGKKNAALF